VDSFVNPLNYLHSAFKQSFTNIKIKNTITNEIKKIKELKSKKSSGYDDRTYVKKVTKHLLITDQFHYFLYVRKFFKRLCIKDYITL